MKATRFLQLYIAFVLIAYTAGAFFAPPGMYSDSGYGFAVWRSMKGGAPFNWLVGPDPGHIAQDAGGFLSTWTPGQYFIPGTLADCGCSLGRALTVTVALFSTVGVFGWYKVYRTFGFSESVAWLSCAVLVSTRFFALPFGIYNGGEVLLFGACPFVLLVALRWCDLRWHQGVLMVIVLLAAFFLKNSALVLALAICTAMPVSNWIASQGSLRHRLLVCFKWGGVFFITCAVAHVAYISRGWTPVAFEPSITERATEKGLFALAGPLLSSISFDDLISFMLSHPNRPLLPDWQTRVVVILPLVLLACLAYYLVAKHYAGARYGTVVLVFLTVYALIFVAFNVLGSPVSSATEARHYRYAGLILLPGLLSVALVRAPGAARWASMAIVFAMCLYGLFSYANKCVYLKRRNSVGSQGVTQLVMSRQTLQWLTRADSDLPPSNSVFYLPSPELGLEVRRGRAILTHADFDSEAFLSKRTYSGTVDNLFVLLPERFSSNGKADIILSSFTNYSAWKSLRVGDYFVYYPAEQKYVPSPVEYAAGQPKAAVGTE